MNALSAFLVRNYRSVQPWLAHLKRAGSLHNIRYAFARIPAEASVQHRLLQDAQALQIVVSPPGLLDHALERLPRECAAPAVEHNGDAPPVGMVVNVVRPIAAIKREPIADQCGNNFSG